MYKRANFRWNINEYLSLQREYELLNLSVEKIAVLHERDVKAILFKLKSEGLINASDELKLKKSPKKSVDEVVVSSLKSKDDTNIANRVFSLESCIDEIKGMIQNLVNTRNTQPVKKVQPLRKYSL